MNSRQRRTVALSLVVSAAFLFLAFRNVPLDELAAALRRLHAGWLLVAIAISLLIMVFRTWRWQLELRPLERVPFGRLWVVTAVAYMAINLLPARLGEVVRPWLLSRRSSVSFSNVVGNLVVEKTMDAVVTLLYILVGLTTIENLPAWVRTGARVPAVGAAALVGLVLLLYWRGEAFVDRAVLRFLPERFGAGVKRVTGAIVAGMQVLPNPRLVLAVFLVSVLLWFLPILSSYVMMRAFELQLPFSAAVVVFIFIGFGTALPNVPGMLGPYQYACILALGLFDVPRPDALAYGLVLNAVQFLSLIGQGLVAWPLAGISVEDLRQATRTVPASGTPAEDARQP
ncbi:flippase-like domain-containing protein [bacterium]|nr:flippase-like domain-containing protein [bacterium]